jgi:hypothetical protein
MHSFFCDIPFFIKIIKKVFIDGQKIYSDLILAMRKDLGLKNNIANNDIIEIFGIGQL